VEVVEAVWESVRIGAGLFWKAFWALAFGYAISAGIQVFLSRREAAKHLGSASPGQLGLAMAFGFASSSCSFAALAATRSLFAKGAHVISALAFMFAATNLAVELAVLLWIFLGWQFVAALFVGAFVLVPTMALIVRLTLPEALAEKARRRAQEVEAGEGEEPELPRRWSERVTSGAAWQQISRSFAMEWKMVWKELAAGFLAAGFVAALVPAAFFQTIFPQDLPAWLLAPIHALLAPVLAIFTVIGSMGNGPLAAVLWQNGVAFAGIMAFLYSDFIVPPALKINITYYGWRFSAYLGLVFAAAAVVAGVVVNALFSLLGLIPDERKEVREIATFALDYTLVLNVAAFVVAAALLWLRRRGEQQVPASARA
jgi:uncharacterized protein